MTRMSIIVWMNPVIRDFFEHGLIQLADVIPAMPVMELKGLAYFDDLEELSPPVLLKTDGKNLSDDGYGSLQFKAEILAPVEQTLQPPVLHSLE